MRPGTGSRRLGADALSQGGQLSRAHASGLRSIEPIWLVLLSRRGARPPIWTRAWELRQGACLWSRCMPGHVRRCRDRLTGDMASSLWWFRRGRSRHIHAFGRRGWPMLEGKIHSSVSWLLRSSLRTSSQGAQAIHLRPRMRALRTGYAWLALWTCYGEPAEAKWMISGVRIFVPISREYSGELDYS